MIKIIVLVMPERFDHNEIRFEINDTGVVGGFGYIGKRDQKIGLIRCPICNAENYIPLVASGQCAWCYFNANDCPIEGGE